MTVIINYTTHWSQKFSSLWKQLKEKNFLHRLNLHKFIGRTVLMVNASNLFNLLFPLQIWASDLHLQPSICPWTSQQATPWREVQPGPATTPLHTEVKCFFFHTEGKYFIRTQVSNEVFSWSNRQIVQIKREHRKLGLARVSMSIRDFNPSLKDPGKLN